MCWLIEIECVYIHTRYMHPPLQELSPVCSKLTELILEVKQYGNYVVLTRLYTQIITLYIH